MPRKSPTTSRSPSCGALKSTTIFKQRGWVENSMAGALLQGRDPSSSGHSRASWELCLAPSLLSLCHSESEWHGELTTLPAFLAPSPLPLSTAFLTKSLHISSHLGVYFSERPNQASLSLFIPPYTHPHLEQFTPHAALSLTA